MRIHTTNTAGRITALILALAALASLCACSLKPGKKTTDSPKEISGYLKDHIGVNIGSYFEEAEMEYENTDSKETANIRIRLNENTIEKVEEIAGMHMAKEADPMSPVPGYQDHPYALEMKKMNITEHYVRAVAGKSSKSRLFDLYIAEDGGTYYVFVFS